MKLITMANSKTFMGRARRIVEIYNDTHNWQESLNLQNPEKTCIVSISGENGVSDSGGVLIDSFQNIPVHRVMFAGFEEQNRGKGNLKKALAFAKDQGLNIQFVEMNIFDDDAPWKALGFQTQVAFQLGGDFVNLLSKPENPVEYLERFSKS